MLRYNWPSGTKMLKKIRNSFIILLLLPASAFSQNIINITIADASGLQAGEITLPDSTILNINGKKPLFSFLLDGKYFNSSDINAARQNGSHVQYFGKGLNLSEKTLPQFLLPDTDLLILPGHACSVLVTGL